MDHYKQIIMDRLEDLAGENRTRAEILKAWAEGETGDDFGNLSGSRTFSTWQAEEDLKAAGFPFDEELNALLEEVGYNMADLLGRGPETIDVIICELLAPQVASEELEELESADDEEGEA